MFTKYYLSGIYSTMPYTTYQPCKALQPFILHFAVQETPHGQTYKVLPGTGLVLGFQYSGGLSKIQEAGTIQLSPAGITGLQDSFSVFKTQPGTNSILVFFKEGGAQAFFKQPLHELFRQSISLDNFMLRSTLLLLEEKLCEAKTDASRITVVEKFLLARLNNVQTDQLVAAALSLIHKSKGNIRIQDLAVQLFTSQSPLEKRFRKVVGASPKKFASIVRIKNAIENYKGRASLTELGYEAGFYDQAHFIKEFKTFTGDTPEAFFKKGITG